MRKNRIGGSKSLPRSISVPMQSIDGNNQVLQGSINVNHFDNFLNCLINSKGGSHWKKIIDNFNNIREFQKKGTFLMYYSFAALDVIKIPRIQAKLILLYKMKKFIDEEKRIYDLNQKNQVSISSVESTNKIPIFAGGSGLESYSSEIIGVGMFLLGALVWSFKDSLCNIRKTNTGNTKKTAASMASDASIAFNANKYRPGISKNPQPNVTKPTWIDSDQRRTVLGCILDDGVRCMFKISKNSHYINEYKMETRVYDQLKALSGVLPVDVIDYYGTSGEELIRINKNPRFLPINIKIGKKRYMTNIRVPEVGDYFYFAMEWDLGYKTLDKALEGGVRTADRDDAIQSVCASLGRLNKDHGFYHGDMKVDNVMINMSDYTMEYDSVLRRNVKDFKVKNMDFDFSGILGAVQNGRMAEAYFDKEKQQVRDYINGYSRSGRPGEGNNFLFFFDIYRLWCSLDSVWSGGSTGRYDTTTSTNRITASNGDIEFKLGDFVDFFTSNGGGVKEMEYFDQSEYEDRNIHSLMENIQKKYSLQSSDWNSTLMHEDIVFALFQYISYPEERRGKDKKGNDSSEEEEEDSSSLVKKQKVGRRSARVSARVSAKVSAKVSVRSRKLSMKAQRTSVNNSNRSSSKPWPGQTKAGNDCKICLGKDPGIFCHRHR